MSPASNRPIFIESPSVPSLAPGRASTGSKPGSFSISSSPYRAASIRLGSPVPSAFAGTPAQGDESAVVDDDAVSSTQNSTTHTPTGSWRPRNYSPLTGTSPAGNALAGLAEGARAASPSVQSIDIDHPDPEVVKAIGRHLVGANALGNGGSGDGVVLDDSRSGSSKSSGNNADVAGDDLDDKFASLKLQGGDITRELYNWQREHEQQLAESSKGRARSRSFAHLPQVAKAAADEEPLQIKHIKVPGGFRREFLIQKAVANSGDPEQGQGPAAPARPTFLTRNFIEFLTIYGHFAGEELEEFEDEDSDEDPTEHTALIGRPRMHARQVSRGGAPGNASATKAVMLLLKSFVGTGVVFLPRAFYNGGILFSSVLLCLISALSYVCFILLVESKEATGVSSFGDIGGHLYGPRVRWLILASIVISQIGFGAAYFVFTSENLRALVLALTGGKVTLSMELLIALQALIHLPLSMIRDIAKLSGTALVADLFILLGLVYLYVFGTTTLLTQGPAEVALFNQDSFSLFIGTAIFTYEGVGLIIPIQQSMKRPAEFVPVLAGVMIAITVIFVSMGALCYAVFGSSVETVVILNLPQDSPIVNLIQLLYSMAIVLSTPLQLFPAIRIMENGLFVRSGKYSSKVKWQKNLFRYGFVAFTALVAYGGSDDLDRFVSITGSFACIPLVYIYPPLLHLKAVTRGPWVKLGDVLIIVFGIWAMVYTTLLTARDWFKK